MGEGRGPAFGAGEVDARVIGDEGFVEKVLGVSGRTSPKPSLDAVVSAVCEALAMDEATLAAPGKGRKEAEARGIVALLAQDTGAAGVKEAGRRFGRDGSATSMALNRVRERMRTDEALKKRVGELAARLQRPEIVGWVSSL